MRPVCVDLQSLANRDRRDVTRRPAAPWPSWALLATVLGCVGPAFRVPTLPTFTTLGRNPTVPAGESVSGAVPNGVTEVQAIRELRLRRDTLLAVGPVVAGDRDLSLPLLQRLLARRTTRVMDLSQSGPLHAQATITRADQAVIVNGPWGALAWAARWGDASMLLVSDPVQVARVADPRQARVRYDPTALASYASEREGRVAECRGRLPRIEAERARVEAEFQGAQREYEASRTWLDRAGRDTDGERARQQVQDALAALEAQRSVCSAALQLPAADALTGHAAAQNERDARTMAQASATFRLVALPGGELLWTASLVRRGDDDAQAVDNLLTAVVDTLNGDHRTPTIGEEPPPAAPAGQAPPPPRHRPRRRRH